METVKEIAGMAAITLLFSLLTWLLAAFYIEEFNLLGTEPSNAIVDGKTADKGLFTSPDYYVWTVDGEETRSLNRVSKSQMEDIKIGGRFEGYSTGSSGFSSVRDIVADSLFFLTAIFLFGVLTICLFVALISSIPALEGLSKKKSSKRKRKRKKKGKRKINGRTTAWAIAGAAALIMTLISVRFVANLVRKVLPFGKTETEAMIIDRSVDIGHGRRRDSTYELTVSFKDQVGQDIQVMREVTRSTYNQYDIGEMLPIAYRSADPYDLFVRGTSFTDVVQTISYYEFHVYPAFLAVSAFVGWAYMNDLRKRKEIQKERDRLKRKKK